MSQAMKRGHPSPYNFDGAALKCILDDNVEGRTTNQFTLNADLCLDGRRNSFSSIGPLQLHTTISAMSEATGHQYATAETDDELSFYDDDDDDDDDYDENVYSVCSDRTKPMRQVIKPLDVESSHGFVFRGAVETWEAFQKGNFVVSTCLDCGEKMICVEDAAYVVCSHCRLVNPVTSHSSKPQYGIGMGFKPKWCLSLLKQNSGPTR
ncbi:expressed unknown protein [Seminavis robusta]|uniref:Uncharacterized protein n=1 Tax=Seminavis robusta TaxID=568900 RepID=A0A9N8EGQ7_9STRA|nr:expressed unknown protein [Seminavis robusta]|eukprot:Sro1056_g236160.1 n/a (208) ;mRNA; r:11466-12089